MKSIVLTGGGTAGHCLPHFAILKELKKHFDSVYYIGGSGVEKDIVLGANIPYYEISTVKLIRTLSPKNLLIPAKLIRSIYECEKILKELNPTVIFSKGGFVGLPVTLAGKRLGIKTVVHESDLSMGLANKIASKHADFTLTSFEKTKNQVKNGVFTGPPIREELFMRTKAQARKILGVTGEKPVLLITGGSLGAKAINDKVVKDINFLTNAFEVVHLVGRGNLTGSNIKGYKEYEFLDMAVAINACDICFSRAGSNTAFELIIKKIPTLFIPLPKASSRGDQIENARYFEGLGVCKTISQEEFVSANLTALAKNLYSEKEKLINAINRSNVSVGNKNIIKILTKY